MHLQFYTSHDRAQTLGPACETALRIWDVRLSAKCDRKAQFRWKTIFLSLPSRDQRRRPVKYEYIIKNHCLASSCASLHSEWIMIYSNSLNNFTAVAAPMSFSANCAFIFFFRSLTICSHSWRGVVVVVAAAAVFCVFFGAGWSQILYYICHRGEWFSKRNSYTRNEDDLFILFRFVSCRVIFHQLCAQFFSRLLSLSHSIQLWLAISSEADGIRFFLLQFTLGEAFSNRVESRTMNMCYFFLGSHWSSSR